MKRLLITFTIAIYLCFSVGIAQAYTDWETGAGTAGLGKRLMINDITLIQIAPDLNAVFTILGVDVSNLNGSGSIELFFNHESGAGINIGFSGPSSELNAARTKYYDSGGSSITIENRSFASGEVSGVLDFRLFFYDILNLDGTRFDPNNPSDDEGQWLFRSQYRINGGAGLRSMKDLTIIG